MIAKRFPTTVSASVVRVTAVQVFVFSVLSLLLKNPWLALILVIDFVLRSLILPLLSPFAFVSRTLVVPAFHLEGRNISYQPKRFAAMIGLSLASLGFIFGINGLLVPFYISIGMLGFFSFLEAAFDFCAGCKIFFLLMRWGVIPPESCPDCHN
jgi:hypothetical protein